MHISYVVYILIYLPCPISTTIPTLAEADQRVGSRGSNTPSWAQPQKCFCARGQWTLVLLHNILTYHYSFHSFLSVMQPPRTQDHNIGSCWWRFKLFLTWDVTQRTTRLWTWPNTPLEKSWIGPWPTPFHSDSHCVFLLLRWISYLLTRWHDPSVGRFPVGVRHVQNV